MKREPQSLLSHRQPILHRLENETRCDLPCHQSARLSRRLALASTPCTEKTSQLSVARRILPSLRLTASYQATPNRQCTADDRPARPPYQAMLSQSARPIFRQSQSLPRPHRARPGPPAPPDSWLRSESQRLALTQLLADKHAMASSGWWSQLHACALNLCRMALLPDSQPEKLCALRRDD